MITQCRPALITCYHVTIMELGQKKRRNDELLSPIRYFLFNVNMKTSWKTMFKVLKLKVQTAGLVFVVNKPQQEKKKKTLR